MMTESLRQPEQPDKTIPSFAEFFVSHYQEKVKDGNCPVCKTNSWTVLTNFSDENNYQVLFSKYQMNTANGQKIADWPMLGTVCNNCHYVRWFAVQPLIDAWQKIGGRFGGAK